LEHLKGKTVLLADDDKYNIYAMTEVLAYLEVNVITAMTGQEAIDNLISNEPVHIVLMDIMMPEMDGYEAMRRIRSADKYKSLPIIALTAKAMKGDNEKCIEAGATDYLSKPVDIDKLYAMIAKYIE
jgi:CheY-like chemotaxis protein